MGSENPGKLSQFLNDTLLPALSAEQIYTDPAHRFHKSGDKWRGACPWHKSASGSSFTVTPSSKLWWCQGCHVGGGPVQYLWRLRGNTGTPRGLDFIQVLEELAGLAGLRLPQKEWTPEDIDREQKRETRRSILQAVMKCCQENIPEGVLSYLASRGFNKDAIKDLGTGFYSSCKEVADYLKKSGYDLKAANDAGVLWRKWEGYIIFPWHDEYGRLLTLYGTWQAKKPPLKNDIPAWKAERDKAFEEWNAIPDGERIPWEEPRVPKKLALPNPKDGADILEHSKRSPLYLDRARKAGHKHIVLVEGVTDAALAQVEGDTRGVACVAAGFSGEQVQTLKRCGIDTVTICLDPDQGGTSGTASCIRMLEDVGIKSLIAPKLPDGLDPDEFIIENGIDAWKAHIESAETPLQRDIKAIAAAKPDRLNLSGLMKPFIPRLVKLPGTERESYLELIKNTFEVKTDFVKALRQEISGDAKLQDQSFGTVKETQAQQLIKLAADAELFHSPDDGRYAIIPQNGHREVWPIRSKGFKNWLDHLFYRDQGKPPGTQGLQDAIRLLEAKALFDGEEHPIYVKVAEYGGNVYLDLCNTAWEAVEISHSGWRVIADPPVKFRRTKGMLSLPKPTSGGNLKDLRPFLNAPDDGAFRLLCGFLVQTLNPSGPYPILNLEGEQGTAKSTTVRVLRSLVDPSTAMLKTAPRDERDLMIAATNSWLLAFDNLSGVENWLSDALCRLSTGGGFSTRELYTDSEETIFDATRPQILNGIDRISSRHDLISRSIVITLPVIPDDKRREEKEFWRDFEAERPRILGALCDAVSCALRKFESIRLKQKPRMADFARWVSAAEPALPWKPGEFMEAYTGNRADAINLALEADTVACTIRQYMDNRAKWDGTAGELLKELNLLAAEDTRKLKSWPKAPNSLSKRLRRAATFLRATGIEITLPSDSWRRDIAIRKHAQKIVETDETVEPCTEQHSTINDQVNDPINDTVGAQETVETSLMRKTAPDKAFHDINGINDKKQTFSKTDLAEVIEEAI